MTEEESRFILNELSNTSVVEPKFALSFWEPVGSLLPKLSSRVQNLRKTKVACLMGGRVAPSEKKLKSSLYGCQAQMGRSGANLFERFPKSALGRNPSETFGMLYRQKSFITDKILMPFCFNRV